MIRLTSGQTEAISAVRHWYFNSEPGDIFFLSGAAGTGKTMLIDYMIRQFGWKALVITPTNKAAQVLIQKGVQAITIHSAIYYPPTTYIDDNGDLELNFEYEGLKYHANVLIIDEVSMVGQKIGDDIMQALYSAKLPVLAVGDIHQLPPVKDVRWIGTPDYELTEVMRHDSEILKLATMIRTTNQFDLDLCELPGLAIKRKISDEDMLAADMILCRTHVRRCSIIKKKRKLLGMHPLRPSPGEPLFVVMNDYGRGLYNGEEVIYQPPNFINGLKRVGIPDGYIIESLKDPNSFRQSNLAFGYANTVHKAQGSEWGNVIVTDIENRHPNETYSEYKQWLYTACTRAREKLILA